MADSTNVELPRPCPICGGTELYKRRVESGAVMARIF
jgi:hypothetical protein